MTATESLGLAIYTALRMRRRDYGMLEHVESHELDAWLRTSWPAMPRDAKQRIKVMKEFVEQFEIAAAAVEYDGLGG